MKLIRLSAFALCLAATLSAVPASRPAASSAAQSFDVCLQDDTAKSNVVRFNSSNGQYTASAGGAALSGTGSVQKQGTAIMLQHNAADRRLQARVDTSLKQGSAVLQAPPGTTRANIRDTNTADSRCH